MTERISFNLRSPFSELESRVLTARRTLPTGFQLCEPGRIDVEFEEIGQIKTYYPAFEVQDSTGRTVLLDVKSRFSLSLSNLVTLVEIDRIAREQGKALLVLLWGADLACERKRNMPPFAGLRIRPVESESEVIDAVKDEFAAAFPREGAQAVGKAGKA